MRAFIASQRDWLVVERLPAYAPDLSPVDSLVVGFLAHTGLTLDP
jgi:hypothetical protein